MIRWPGRVKPSDCPHLASSLDLAPTLLRAAGLPVPADLPGLNLLDADAVAQRSAIHGEIFTHDSQSLDNPAASLRWRWIIDGHTKLIVPHPANEPDARVEMYDLAADPDEATNLAPAHPDQVKALTARLDAWWSP
jgi:arylsulfatase A-like enzyme